MRLNQAHLQAGSAPEYVLRASGILHAGQLHNDAVSALLLDDRFGDTEFVDAVAQGCDVLFERRLLGVDQGLRRQGGCQTVLAGIFTGLDGEITGEFLQLATCFVARFGVTKTHENALTFATNTGVSDLLVAQRVADETQLPVEAFILDRLHVDLQQEMDTTAQIKTQIHRQRVDRGKPRRRIGNQVERQNKRGIVRHRVQRAVKHVLGLQLRVGIAESYLDAIRIGKNPVIRNGRRLERLLDRLHGDRVHLGGGLERGHLHRRHLAEKIRQRVGNADQHQRRNEQVFPERIAIHVCVAL